MSLNRGKWRNGGNYFRSRLLSSLKLPVGWLDFLGKSPYCLGCGAQRRCVWSDTKMASWRPYLCVTNDVFLLRMSHVGCANRLGKKKKKERKKLFLRHSRYLTPTCNIFFWAVVFDCYVLVNQQPPLFPGGSFILRLAELPLYLHQVEFCGHG